MATQVIMPKVDMVMDTGTLVEWLKQEGEHVEKGEPLFVILTDKANIEIEAPASGILAGVRAKPNDVVPVTETIAYILEPGETLPDMAVPAAAVRVSEEAPTTPTAAQAPAQPTATAAGKVRATPAARRRAAELGVDLAQVTGRGARGRVHTADVLAFAQQQQPVSTPAVATAAPRPTVVAPAVQLPPTPARQKEVVPFSGPRRIIAERMAHSAFSAPHITLALRVDMSEAARLRARVQEPIQRQTGQRLSYTAIIARAVAAVLPRHPMLNASLQGEQIVAWEDVHLGIATNLDEYLIVPVIREAQSKNLEQIVAALGDLVERARARRLTPTEMSGSTFTISNLGMFGIEWFTAIINPPETAILAVGQIMDTPVGVDNQVVLRPMMNLTLAADHRVVDGAMAARFLADLKTTLENPYLLI